ncbi:Bacterial membrane protein YfhO [Thalassoglobus neptunius]|uniref:Bacterial membrane protein YfhO n=1 Tax=Thalassoglobus neptunius TaxID=1938619 RepID=A0A5C5XAZ0_9PLAN|nr:YfhO family protein [Thalassoglobus neptunius]TWT59062.1 Bacterial membrane protein YfhO [Thalassoglobus neptunius]
MSQVSECEPFSRSDRNLFWVSFIAALIPYSFFLVPSDRVIPQTYYSDYTTAQLPLREFARDEILSGRFPLWIPELGCGMPLHANMQAGLTDPLVTPWVLAVDASYGLRLSIVFHAVLGFCGQYFLTRTLGVSRFASSFSALAMTLSGFPIAHLMVGHITMFTAWTRLPWLLWSVVNLTRRPGPWTAGLTAVAGGLVLISGHPQIACYAGLLGSLWAMISFFWGSASLHKKSFLIWASVALLLSISLAAVQYIPAMELILEGMSHSDRGKSAYANNFALQPSDFIRLVIPNFKGNPFDDEPTSNFFELYHEEYQYLGIITLVLCGIALIRKSVRAWEVVAGFSILLLMLYSLGNDSYVFAAFNKAISPLILFRCPGRVLSLASILAPILAARGLDGWMCSDDRLSAQARIDGEQSRKRSHKRSINPCVLAGWAVLLLTGNILAWHILNDFESGFGDEIQSWWNRSEVFQNAVLKATAVSVSSIWVLMHLRSMRNTPSTTLRFHWQFLFLAVITIDLWLMNASQFRLVQLELPLNTKELQTGSYRSYRFIDRSLNTNDILLQLRYSRMLPVAVLNRFPMVGTNEGGIFPSHVQKVHEAIKECPENVLDLISSRAVYTQEGVWIKRETSIPRVRFLPQQLRHLADIPLCEVSPLDWKQDPDFRYEILSENSRELLIDVDLPEPGVVGLADTRFPGWKCSVDGQPIEIEALHEVFRMCTFPAGRHRLRFRYDPPSFYFGIVITGLSVCMTIGLLIVGRRSRSHSDNHSGEYPQECLSESHE